MSDTLDYLKMFVRFPVSLGRFLKHNLTPEQARQIVHERMAQREENFLQLAERSIYNHPRSPYLSLLKAAGCTFADLQALVKSRGLEKALKELRNAGVYVTFEEFKGRKPIERNGAVMPVAARDFDNPFARRDLTSETGGSTGAALNIGIDLDNIAARTSHQLITLAAHGLTGVPTVSWRGILPDGGLRTLLRSLYTGNMLERWYSPIGWRDSKHWMKYDLATYYALLWMRLYGKRVPLPKYVRIDEPHIIAQAMADVLKVHGRCLLRTPVSRALRISLAVQELGINLNGAVITGGGEPTTPAKIHHIEKAGMKFIPMYGMVEASTIGSGCAHRADVSDVHVYLDAFELFSHPYEVEGASMMVQAFNLTALLLTAPKVMLNVQMDDYGIVEERACGCELETYGFTKHVREIRSYSKLVGEGVTLVGNEMLRVLEEVLPARFGGSLLDYQLVEQEDEVGFTRLWLAISPRVTIANEQLVLDTLHQGLQNSSPMADAARTIWQQAQTIQIKRVEPEWTARGKFPSLLRLNRGKEITKPQAED